MTHKDIATPEDIKRLTEQFRNDPILLDYQNKIVRLAEKSVLIKAVIDDNGVYKLIYSNDDQIGFIRSLMTEYSEKVYGSIV